MSSLASTTRLYREIRFGTSHDAPLVERRLVALFRTRADAELAGNKLRKRDAAPGVWYCVEVLDA